MTPPAEILIVDDTESGRYRNARILRRAGFEVMEVESGAEALRVVAERLPRLVLLDINLPDLSGWEVCRRIKSAVETSSVLVLQTSATFVTEADTVRSLDGGADACLTEPIEPTVLVATVRALLRAREAEDALRDSFEREQSARAAAEQANRTKDDFLATLSHELRSPIGVILTWVSLLRAGRLDAPKVDRAVDAIERNARLQAKMVEDLLDVSRIISGNMRLDIALVDLTPIVNAALDAVRPAADAKSIHIDVDLDPTLGAISGDAARLQQVVWNLLSNAVKFTPKGGSVKVRTELVDSIVKISVSDTGKGIDPTFLPHVFERFRQADETTTRSEGGLGLGLAIVRHLVELHGGTVEAQSEGAGSGSSFIVRLPLPAVRMSNIYIDGDEWSKRLPINALEFEGLKILVVDDESDAREALSLVFEQFGAEIRTAGSVALAKDAAQEFRPHLIVSDIAMPSEDGFALIKWLRERGGDLAGIPAIALTAYARSEDRNRILSAGFQAYLAKPIDVDELAHLVSRLTEEPRSRV